MLAAAIRGAERHRFTPERARFSGGDLIILAIDEVIGVAPQPVELALTEGVGLAGVLFAPERARLARLLGG